MSLKTACSGERSLRKLPINLSKLASQDLCNGRKDLTPVVPQETRGLDFRLHQPYLCRRASSFLPL